MANGDASGEGRDVGSSSCELWLSMVMPLGLACMAVVLGFYLLAHDDSACEGFVVNSLEDMEAADRGDRVCDLLQVDMRLPGAELCFQSLRPRKAALLLGLTDYWTSHDWSSSQWQDALQHLSLPVRDTRLASIGGGQIQANHTSASAFFAGGLAGTSSIVFSISHKDDLVRQLLEREFVAIPDVLQGVNANPVFSLGGVGSGLYYHQHHESWLALLQGEKQWYIRPPHARPSSAHRRADEQEWAEEPGVLRCLQRPGEVLFLPERWWHATVNRETEAGMTLGFGGNGESEGPRKHALQENVDALSKMLAEGALDEGQFPDLMRAASLAGHLKILSFLVARSASTDPRSASGSEAISGAVRAGHSAALAFLLSSGGRVDSEGEGGLQFVHEAARQGHLEILSALVEHRADPVRARENSLLPVHTAAVQGHVGALDYILQWSLNASVVRHLEAVDDRNLTPLHYAAAHGHVAVLDWLRARGASEGEGDSPVSPTRLAASRGHVEVVAWFARIDRSGFNRSVLEQLLEDESALSTQQKAVERLWRIMDDDSSPS